LIQLKDKYIKVSDIITGIQKFNKKNFNDMKIKTNPVFIDGYAIVQIKKFEGITDAIMYYKALEANATEVVGESNVAKAAFFIIAPSNFKLIKTTDDLDIYAPFFKNNYIKE
jgi:hypothetical protein